METPSLNGAELRVRRERLGLTMQTLANVLHVREDTVRKWEHGQDPIPPGITIELADIETFADEIIDRLEAAGRPVIAWDNERSFEVAHPELAPYGPRFWRHCAADAGVEIRHPLTFWAAATIAAFNRAGIPDADPEKVALFADLHAYDDDEHLGILVDSDGRIIATTTYVPERNNHYLQDVYVTTESTIAQPGQVATIAKPALERSLARPLAYIRLTDITRVKR